MPPSVFRTATAAIAASGAALSFAPLIFTPSPPPDAACGSVQEPGAEVRLVSFEWDGGMLTARIPDPSKGWVLRSFDEREGRQTCELPTGVPWELTFTNRGDALTPAKFSRVCEIIRAEQIPGLYVPGYWRVSVPCLEDLTRCPSLSRLTLSLGWSWKQPGSGLLNAEVEPLTRMDWLRHLSLAEAQWISDEALARTLEQLPDLESFEVGSHNQVGRKTLGAAAKLKKLRGLHLRDSGDLDGEAMRALAGSISLRSLVLDDCEALTSEALENLACLRSLTQLGIPRCRGVDLSEGALLDKLPALRELDISWTGPIPGDLFARLAASRELRVLRLRGCKAVPFEELLEFIQESRLERLDLRGVAPPVPRKVAAALAEIMGDGLSL